MYLKFRCLIFLYTVVCIERTLINGQELQKPHFQVDHTAGKLDIEASKDSADISFTNDDLDLLLKPGDTKRPVVAPKDVMHGESESRDELPEKHKDPRFNYVSPPTTNETSTDAQFVNTPSTPLTGNRNKSTDDDQDKISYNDIKNIMKFTERVEDQFKNTTSTFEKLADTGEHPEIGATAEKSEHIDTNTSGNENHKNITWKGRINQTPDLVNNNVLDTLNELKDLVSVSLHKSDTTSTPADHSKRFHDDSSGDGDSKSSSKDDTLNEANAIIKKIEKQEQQRETEDKDKHPDDLFYVTKAQEILQTYKDNKQLTESSKKTNNFSENTMAQKEEHDLDELNGNPSLHKEDDESANSKNLLLHKEDQQSENTWLRKEKNQSTKDRTENSSLHQEDQHSVNSPLHDQDESTKEHNETRPLHKEEIEPKKDSENAPLNNEENGPAREQHENTTLHKDENSHHENSSLKTEPHSEETDTSVEKLSVQKELYDEKSEQKVAENNKHDVNVPLSENKIDKANDEDLATQDEKSERVHSALRKDRHSVNKTSEQNIEFSKMLKEHEGTHDDVGGHENTNLSRRKISKFIGETFGFEPVTEAQNKSDVSEKSFTTISSSNSDNEQISETANKIEKHAQAVSEKNKKLEELNDMKKIENQENEKDTSTNHAKSTDKTNEKTTNQITGNNASTNHEEASKDSSTYSFHKATNNQNDQSKKAKELSERIRDDENREDATMIRNITMKSGNNDRFKSRDDERGDSNKELANLANTTTNSSNKGEQNSPDNLTGRNNKPEEDQHNKVMSREELAEQAYASLDTDLEAIKKATKQLKESLSRVKDADDNQISDPSQEKVYASIDSSLTKAASEIDDQLKPEKDETTTKDKTADQKEESDGSGEEAKKTTEHWKNYIYEDADDDISKAENHRRRKIVAWVPAQMKHAEKVRNSISDHKRHRKLNFLKKHSNLKKNHKPIKQHGSEDSLHQNEEKILEAKETIEKDKEEELALEAKIENMETAESKGNTEEALNDAKELADDVAKELKETEQKLKKSKAMLTKDSKSSSKRRKRGESTKSLAKHYKKRYNTKTKAKNGKKSRTQKETKHVTSENDAENLLKLLDVPIAKKNQISPKYHRNNKEKRIYKAATEGNHRKTENAEVKKAMDELEILIQEKSDELKRSTIPLIINKNIQQRKEKIQRRKEISHQRRRVLDEKPTFVDAKKGWFFRDTKETSDDYYVNSKPITKKTIQEKKHRTMLSLPGTSSPEKRAGLLKATNRLISPTPSGNIVKKNKTVTNDLHALEKKLLKKFVDTLSSKKAELSRAAEISKISSGKETDKRSKQRLNKDLHKIEKQLMKKFVDTLASKRAELVNKPVLSPKDAEKRSHAVTSDLHALEKALMEKFIKTNELLQKKFKIQEKERKIATQGLTKSNKDNVIRTKSDFTKKSNNQTVGSTSKNNTIDVRHTLKIVDIATDDEAAFYTDDDNNDGKTGMEQRLLNAANNNNDMKTPTEDTIKSFYHNSDEDDDIDDDENPDTTLKNSTMVTNTNTTIKLRYGQDEQIADERNTGMSEGKKNDNVTLSKHTDNESDSQNATTSNLKHSSDSTQSTQDSIKETSEDKWVPSNETKSVITVTSDGTSADKWVPSVQGDDEDVLFENDEGYNPSEKQSQIEERINQHANENNRTVGNENVKLDQNNKKKDPQNKTVTASDDAKIVEKKKYESKTESNPEEITNLTTTKDVNKTNDENQTNKSANIQEGINGNKTDLENDNIAKKDNKESNQKDESNETEKSEKEEKDINLKNNKETTKSQPTNATVDKSENEISEEKKVGFGFDLVKNSTFQNALTNHTFSDHVEQADLKQENASKSDNQSDLAADSEIKESDLHSTDSDLSHSKEKASYLNDSKTKESVTGSDKKESDSDAAQQSQEKWSSESSGNDEVGNSNNLSRSSTGADKTSVEKEVEHFREAVTKLEEKYEKNKGNNPEKYETSQILKMPSESKEIKSDDSASNNKKEKEENNPNDDTKTPTKENEPGKITGDRNEGKQQENNSENPGSGGTPTNNKETTEDTSRNQSNSEDSGKNENDSPGSNIETGTINADKEEAVKETKELLDDPSEDTRKEEQQQNQDPSPDPTSDSGEKIPEATGTENEKDAGKENTSGTLQQSSLKTDSDFSNDDSDGKSKDEKSSDGDTKQTSTDMEITDQTVKAENENPDQSTQESEDIKDSSTNESQKNNSQETHTSKVISKDETSATEKTQNIDSTGDKNIESVNNTDQNKQQQEAENSKTKDSEHTNEDPYSTFRRSKIHRYYT